MSGVNSKPLAPQEHSSITQPNPMLHSTPYNHWPPTYYHPRWTTHQSISYTFFTLRLVYAVSCVHSFNKYLQQGTEYTKVYKNRQDPCRTQSSSLSFQFLARTVALPSETPPIPPFLAVLQSSSKPPIKTSGFLTSAPIEFCLYLTLAFTPY